MSIAICVSKKTEILLNKIPARRKCAGMCSVEILSCDPKQTGNTGMLVRSYGHMMFLRGGCLMLAF